MQLELFKKTEGMNWVIFRPGSCTGGNSGGGGNNEGGDNNGGGGNSEGLRFEDLVRLLVSTRGEAALRRRCPFWTTGNVKTIETLIVYTVLLMSRISQVSRCLSAVVNLKETLEQLGRRRGGGGNSRGIQI